jgi:fumarylpyruvate hydrolase
LITPGGAVPTGTICLTVNGVVKQESSLADMIWSVPETIARLSRQVAVAAGDLVYTGTPEGVAGISKGDVLRATVTGLEPLSITIT